MARIFEHGTPAYQMEFGQGMTYSTPLTINGGDRAPVPAMSPTEPVDERVDEPVGGPVGTTEDSNL